MGKKLDLVDVAIVGGGLVGNSLALALAPYDFKIAIFDQAQRLERAPLLKNKNATEVNKNFDSRALALSHPSLQCLEALSVWPKIKQFATPIVEVHVSSKGHFGETRLRAKDEGLLELGQVINADILTEALSTEVHQYNNITVYNNAQITQLQQMGPKRKCDTEESRDQEINLTACDARDHTEKARETTTNLEHFTHWQIAHTDKIIQAKLLVAADGTDSCIRQLAGIGTIVKNNQQTAIIIPLELSHAHQNIAYERFTEQGSIAMLPMDGNKMKCVWIVNNHYLQEESLQELDDALFLQKLQSTFGNRLGKFLSVGKRIFYPLKSVYAENVYQPRLVFIGNAANTLNPVAAQGFNLGLRDAATLAELLITAKFRNKTDDIIDIGDIEILKTYLMKRQRDHELVKHFTERLSANGANRKNSAKNANFAPSANLALPFGITMSEFFPPIKKWINQVGLGFRVELPSLCRGAPIL